MLFRKTALFCASCKFVVTHKPFASSKKYRLPALAVGLGVYLPPDIILATVVGGVVRHLVQRSSRRVVKEEELQKAENVRQNGLLTACGLVAGAALMGVVLAIPFVMMGSANALSIIDRKSVV